MSEKLTSVIASLSINRATFENVEIRPLTRVNFFYGGNGTGKSTIAKVINDHFQGEVFFSDGHIADDFDILLFDREYIDDNFHSYEGIPGVLTVNETNVQLNEELKKVREEQGQAIARGKEFAEKQSEKQAEIDALQTPFTEELWKLTKDARTKLKKALGTDAGTKEKFLKSIGAHIPRAEINFDELKRNSDLAYDKGTLKYNNLNSITDPSVLDSIAGYDLLKKAIVSTSNSSFASFLNKTQALDWVKEGHGRFQESASGKCPYCQQPLPSDFETKLSECFDEQYKEDIRKLEQFCTTYSSTCTKVLNALKANLECSYPEFRKSEYQKLISSFETATQLNLELLGKKVKQPSLIVGSEGWKQTTNLLEDISQFVAAENEKIEINNKVADNKKEAQAKCRQDAWSYVRFLCDDAIKNHDKKSSEIQSEIRQLINEVDAQNKIASNLQGRINELNKQGVNVESTIEDVNKLLRDAGFQGFSLVAHKEGVGTYDVVRENGSVADNLSEGERNFIAFLYFYQTVMGKGVFSKLSSNEDSASLENFVNEKKKIVVIDDPVSSLDSRSLFITSSLVRRLINCCHDTHSSFVRQKGELETHEKFIEQIFILTHNAYFHNEVTNGLVNDYEGVSLFIVRKRDNKSSVELCERDSKVFGQKENCSPVKNTYASLWEELKYLYKENGSPIEVKNVSRRILEQYFLHSCGYEGLTLQETVIEKVNADGLAGSLEATVIYSLLRFISCQSSVFDDQAQLEDDGISLDTHKQAFKRIFEIMGQEQHYKMMMGIQRA